MKKMVHFVAACGILASIGLSTAVDARPVHHHQQCKWVWQHHHKVRHCR